MSRWRDAEPLAFWLDDPGRPARRPRISGTSDWDLVVVGGGFTGLWAALAALEADPGRSVLLLEGSRIADAASGRNGGFCSASLTHGDPNARSRWPADAALLHELGQQNLEDLIADVDRLGIDCGLERRGELTIATEAWQAAELRSEAALDPALELLEGADLRAEFASPVGLAGLLDEAGGALVNPARLAWGLADAVEAAGGRIAEGSCVRRLRREGPGLRLELDGAVVEARRCLLATSASRSLTTRGRGRVVPVYDYVLMTEPLGEGQLAEVGWPRRRGVSDAGNRFHYLRLSADDRILFGGFEAVYRFAQRVDPRHDEDPEVFALLERHFDEMFPMLDGIGFSHRWGGAIDTSTRFCASIASSHGGRVATVNGFTGLGVGASRFFAREAVARLDGRRTQASRLAMLETTSPPFPPEPVRSLGIQATRRALARADEHDGRRGPWLRLLDRLGLGFDS